MKFGVEAYTRFNAIVRSTKTPATHLVASVRRESRDFDLFFEKYVSVLPLSAPESPELLPDWSTTMQISVMHATRCTIRKVVLTILMEESFLSNVINTV